MSELCTCKEMLSILTWRFPGFIYLHKILFVKIFLFIRYFANHQIFHYDCKLKTKFWDLGNNHILSVCDFIAITLHNSDLCLLTHS